MFKALSGLSSPSCDVVVVGSGPAGLALSGALTERGARVVLLESGGIQAREDPLNDVVSTGLPFPGASSGRARGFGGTGELWAGQCLPLDLLDLRARSWVRSSGWPITPEDLDPWIQRASAFFALAGATYTPLDLQPLALPAISPELLQWRVLRYSPDRRVGSRSRSSVSSNPRLIVVTDATVTDLLRQGDRIAGVSAVSRDGTAGEVSAASVVLATGAIENARLLLLAGQQRFPVPGNSGGWVGRGLQDHPHWVVGELLNPDPAVGVAFQSATSRGGRARAKLRLPDAQQQLQRTLNAVLDIELDHGPQSAVGAAKRLWDAFEQRRWPDHVSLEARRLIADPLAIGREVVARRRGTGSTPDAHTRLLVRVQTEQPPAGDSRVSLADETDALGCRRAAVHWTVGLDEQKTCLAMAELAREAFGRAGLGRLAIEPWLEDLTAFKNSAQDFYHHAGTTRMGRTEADGVVDGQLAVHGVSGLYVLGGSVFPTSGYANPTLTIVALALRLADHLAVQQAPPTT